MSSENATTGTPVECLVRPLVDSEIDALCQRFHLAAVFDRRGPDIRLLSYAEKLDLLPRLLVTTVEQRKRGREIARVCGCLEPGEDGRPACNPPCISCQWCQ